MSRTRSSSTGRYQARCAPGDCVADATAGTSKIEHDIFILLGFVLGKGKQDYWVGGRRDLRTDMGFFLPDFTLVFEYDGTYWHKGKEVRDEWKAEQISRPWDGVEHAVMRIRESPLRVSRPFDVGVPPRADAATCVRLALLHAAHVFGQLATDWEALSRIERFLAASAGSLAKSLSYVVCWRSFLWPVMAAPRMRKARKWVALRS